MTSNAHITANGCRCRWHIPTAWTLLILFDVFAFALVYSQEPTPVNPGQTVVQVAPLAESTITEIEGPDDVAENHIRFEALDVILDSGDVPLAAWQFELTGPDDRVTIVGIEGGEHAAFAEPPFYDPRAMNNNRVVLAAFNTGDELPVGRSRVARIHVQVKGGGVQQYRTMLTASADHAGNPIHAEMMIRKAGG